MEMFLPHCIEYSRQWASSHIHKRDILCHYVGNHTYRTCDTFAMDIDYTNIIDIHWCPEQNHLDSSNRMSMVNILDRSSPLAHCTNRLDNRRDFSSDHWCNSSTTLNNRWGDNRIHMFDSLKTDLRSAVLLMKRLTAVIFPILAARLFTVQCGTRFR